MKKIHLSTITDDFNENEDIVLGPWSFIGKEDKFLNWENFVFEPDTYINSEEASKNSKLTVEYAEYYLPILSNYLNEVNNSNFPVCFWKVITFPWLLTLTQTTWERQIRVDRLLDKYHNSVCEIELIEDNVEWNFKNTLAHQQEGLLSHSYNHWLFSRLIEKKVPKKWQVKWVKKTDNNIVHKDENITWKKNISNFFANTFPSSTVYGVGRFSSLFFEILLRSKQNNKNNQTKDFFKHNNNSSKIVWNLDWEGLIKSTMPTFFRNINTLPLKWYEKRSYFLIGPVLWYEERLKLKLAKGLINGSKIITTQHGGSYGTCHVYPFSPEIEYKHYRFLSWGWSRQGNYLGNIVPLPSPLLSSFKYKQKNNKIILITYRAMLYSYRISSIPQPIQQIQNRIHKLDFINTITNKIEDNFFYRPPLNELGSLKDKDYFLNRFPKLKILRGKLHNETMKCRLLLLDHPDTTLNIALSANIPTICFWNNTMWEMCVQAKPYFEKLRQVGILFDSGHEAATRVNEIYDNLESWWYSNEVQRARKDWVSQYAKKSKSWRREWVKALCKI